MQEIKHIPQTMCKAAERLQEGKLLIVYKDGNTIRCETERGDNPYVWRKNKWHIMR